MNTVNQTISLMSWNIMGKTWHFVDGTILSDWSQNFVYRKIDGLLNELKPDIICFQEARQYQKINIDLKNRGYNLVFSEKEINFNLIASKFAIVRSGEVPLENISGFTGVIKPQQSECIWADCCIDDGSLIRIYNCRFRVRGIGIKERILFLNKVIEHAKSAYHPVVICGDMNTTIPKHGFCRAVTQFIHNEPDSSMYIDGSYYKNDERHAFNSVAKASGFTDVFDLGESTWAFPYTSWEIFKLKLDWFFISSGLEYPHSFLGKYITDHRYLFVELHNKDTLTKNTDD